MEAEARANNAVSSCDMLAMLALVQPPRPFSLNEPISCYRQGQKGGSAYIPRHASPAVAASAAAAREAAAAGNGEILPATSLFVRKVRVCCFRHFLERVQFFFFFLM